MPQLIFSNNIFIYLFFSNFKSENLRMSVTKNPALLMLARKVEYDFDCGD